MGREVALVNTAGGPGSRLARLLALLMIALILPVAAAGCGDDESDLNQTLEAARQKVDAENADLINQSFTVTATKLVYPYTPVDKSFAPEAGYQYVLVTVTVRNTGENPVVAAYTDFSLTADDGNTYLASVINDLDNDFGAARSPIPGSEESGTLAFEIPATAHPAGFWQEIGPEPGEVALPPNEGTGR